MDTQRLIDRSLIPETVAKMYYGFDTRRPEILAAEVFAPTIDLDFTALFGGEAQQLSNGDLVAYWMKLRDYCTVTQHSLSGTIPFFPRADAPHKDDPIPVFTNVLVYLRREVQGQEPKETHCDATLDLELVRLSPGGWRVSRRMLCGSCDMRSFGSIWRRRGER